MAHDSQIELKKTSSSATVGPANDKHQTPIQHYHTGGKPRNYHEIVLT